MLEKLELSLFEKASIQEISGRVSHESKGDIYLCLSKQYRGGYRSISDV